MSTRVGVDHCSTSDLRIARKRHTCIVRFVMHDDCQPIMPGDPYVSHVVFPGHEIAEVDHPTRYAECVDCWTSRTGSRPQVGAS